MRNIKGMAIAMIASMSVALAACGDPPANGSGGSGGSNEPDNDYEELSTSASDAVEVALLAEVADANVIHTVRMVHPMTGQPITDAEITEALNGQRIDLSDADVPEAERRELERATGLMMIAMGGCMQKGKGAGCSELQTTRAQLKRLAEASAS